MPEADFTLQYLAIERRLFTQTSAWVEFRRMTLVSPLWLGEEGALSDVVLSTRVRIARNLLDLPFPHSATPEQLRSSRAIVTERLCDRFGPLKETPLEATSLDERADFVGARIAGTAFWHPLPERSILTSADLSLAGLANEEDHLRLQKAFRGWSAQRAISHWEHLSERIGTDWAHSRKLGYLTASPINLGGGARLGLMAHLPGLHRSGGSSRWIQALQTLGATARGLYGEGSATVQGFVQISALSGRSELSETVAQIRAIVDSIALAEREARQTIASSDIKGELEEALVVAVHSETLSLGACLKLIGACRMASMREIVPAYYGEFDRLLFELPAYPPPEPAHAGAVRKSRIVSRLRAMQLVG